MTTPPATPRARRVAVPRALAARDDLADAHYAWRSPYRSRGPGP